MTPQILRLPRLHLMGLSARFIPPSSPRCNNLEVIPRLYARFCPLIPQLPRPVDSYIYGAARRSSVSTDIDPDELEYLASVHVTPEVRATAPFVSWHIPETAYASFMHRGSVSTLGRTIQYALQTWLPQSDYCHAGSPNLDRQDERFGDGGGDSQVELLIPIMPRAGYRDTLAPS